MLKRGIVIFIWFYIGAYLTCFIGYNEVADWGVSGPDRVRTVSMIRWSGVIVWIIGLIFGYHKLKDSDQEEA